MKMEMQVEMKNEDKDEDKDEDGISYNVKLDLFWFEIGFVRMWSWISSIVKLDFFLNLIVWYKLGFTVLTWTHGVDLKLC